MKRTYAAFISYRHAQLDSAVAKALHSLIEQYRIPRGLHPGGKKKLGIVFRDEEELHASSDLSNEISYALDNADFLIVVCSRNTAQSPWVSREIQRFLEHHDRSRVLTVLASGEPGEVFPSLLTHVQEPDGTIREVEPLAVDVRASSIGAMRKKLRRELPRLISAMLDCPYDALVMREQKRKTRRVLAAAALAVAVMAGFLSMLLVKNQQIELRNQELARQKAEVQFRESQLLVHDALEALANGDYFPAMEAAIAALPKDNSDDRPYYAPAEQVLLDAMNVFRAEDSPIVLNTTELDQTTKISYFCLSEDGGTAVTVDPYGTVHCFATDSGDLKWKTTVTPPENASLLSGSCVFMLEGQSGAVCYYRGQLAAFDLQFGKPLWRLDLSAAADNCIFYRAESDTIVFITAGTNENGGSCSCLIAVSGKSGQILQSIPLPGTIPPSVYLFGDFFKSVPPCGTFSDDGTLFAGTFLDESYTLCCYVADLQAGTGAVVYRHTQSGTGNAHSIGISFRDDNRSLVIAVQKLAEPSPVSVLKIDAANGSVLWRTDLPQADSTIIDVLTAGYSCLVDNLLLVGYGDRVYCLELEEGQLCSTQQTSGNIAMMQYLYQRVFAFATSNGIYAIGIASPDGQVILTTNSFYQVWASLGPHNHLQIWGGGIVQLHTDDYFELSVSNTHMPGYVAVVPRDAECTLQVIRPVQMHSAVERSQIPLPEKNLTASGGSTVFRTGNLLLIGPMYERNSQIGEYVYTFAALDITTHEVTLLQSAMNPQDVQDIYWIPETLDAIQCNRFGEITFISRDGTKSVLSSTDNNYIWRSDALYSLFYLTCSAAEYLSDDGSLLVAKTGLDSLTIWHNGEAAEILRMPGRLICPPSDVENYARLLCVGGNGCVLTSLHPRNGTVSLPRLAVYDTAAGIWYTYDGNTAFPNTSAFALAGEQMMFAAIDANSIIHIYDIATGAEITQFASEIPVHATEQMLFILNDTCLLLKTEDGRIMIYDISTGEALYFDQLDADVGEAVRYYADEANQRLYITCGIGNSDTGGLCLDMRSWTRLGYISGILYFDPATGVLYQCCNDYSEDAISCFTVPDTSELIAIGQALLDAE